MSREDEPYPASNYEKPAQSASPKIEEAISALTKALNRKRSFEKEVAELQRKMSDLRHQLHEATNVVSAARTNLEELLLKR